jgi:multicomponent Na+:H+ antiporter subunit G
VRAVAVDALLAVLVLAAWLGCAGFARLRSPLDRLHCVTFVNAACGMALVAVAFVADGASDRAFKVLLLVAAALLSGAAVAHATGRALVLRGSAEAGEVEER